MRLFRTASGRYSKFIAVPLMISALLFIPGCSKEDQHNPALKPSSSSSPTITPPSSPSAIEYTNITSSELLKTVAEDLDTAKQKYTGKQLSIHGGVFSYDLNRKDRYVALSDDTSMGSTNLILCHIENEPPARALDASYYRQMITVNGTCTSIEDVSGTNIVNIKVHSIESSEGQREFEKYTAQNLLNKFAKDMATDLNSYNGKFLEIEGTITRSEQDYGLKRQVKYIDPETDIKYSNLDKLPKTVQSTLKDSHPSISLFIFNEGRFDKETINKQFDTLGIGSKVRVKCIVVMPTSRGLGCDVLSIMPIGDNANAAPPKGKAEPPKPSNNSKPTK